MSLPPLIKSMVDASVDAAAIVDRELRILHYNSDYLRLAGLRPRELANRDGRGMCHEHFGLESCNDGCLSMRALECGRPLRVHEVASSKLPLRLIVTAVPISDESGAVYAVMEVYRDVTAESRMQENYRRLLEQERAQKELLAAEVTRQTVELERTNESLRNALHEVSRLARIDGLTELINRRHFDEQLLELMRRAESSREPLALLLFDLDNFKRVNDEHGHPTGDRLLRDFAQVLRSSIRAHDLAARIGGEEFALVLPGASAADAARIAARVQENGRDAGLLTTASGGFAIYPTDGHAGSALLRAADRALYAAKHAGRNRVLAAAAVPGASLPTADLHRLTSPAAGAH